VGLTIKKYTMAKRKKGKRRTRRVGAFGGKKDMGLKLAALAGGVLLANTINSKLDALTTKTTAATATTPATTTTPPNMLLIVGELGLGGLLLLRKTGGTMGMISKVAGGLLAGAGLGRALKTMGIMSGYQAVPVIGKHRMAGYQLVPVIGQRTTPPQLAGKPSQLQGFRVNGYTPTGSGVMGGIGAVDGGSGINTSGTGYMS
jgi:hypothetical protein